jgi:DNA-binding transcriptional LysR family regulator
MSDFILSGHVVDLVLAVLAAEVLLLAAWRRHGAPRGRIVTLIAAALPGAFLMLALRAALAGAGWVWIALWLAASFPAHLVDLRRRPPPP